MGEKPPYRKKEGELIYLLLAARFEVEEASLVMKKKTSLKIVRVCVVHMYVHMYIRTDPHTGEKINTRIEEGKMFSRFAEI